MKPYLVFISASILLSCNLIGGERINGNGNIATENRQVGDFKNVSSSGSVDVVLKQSSSFLVQVKGDKNLLPYITTETDGSTLKIRIKKGYNLNSEKALEVLVSAPEFHDVSMDGSGNLSSSNTLTSRDKMNFDLSGSGDINAQIDAPAVESNTSGSGDVSFSGRAANAEMSVSGSGDIHCFGLTSENIGITINGSGDADVYATKQLNLTVNGSGDVRYKGGASVNSHINGSGSASKAD